MQSGDHAKVVLVGPRSNPRGAVLVTAPADSSDKAATIPLLDHLDQLSPDQVLEILITQERAFGSGLLAPMEEP